MVAHFRRKEKITDHDGRVPNVLSAGRRAQPHTRIDDVDTIRRAETMTSFSKNVQTHFIIIISTRRERCTGEREIDSERDENSGEQSTNVLELCCEPRKLTTGRSQESLTHPSSIGES